LVLLIEFGVIELRSQWRGCRHDHSYCWSSPGSDQCSCGETQTMSHIVKSCPLTRLHGGLFKLHSADDDAVAWLTSYGS